MSLRKLSLVLLASLMGCCLGLKLAAQTHTTPAAPHVASADGLYNPVADPKAVVTLGNARFTVLTPELIRMEWAKDGKFEDHASFVFLNRRLPVPKFETGSPFGSPYSSQLLSNEDLRAIKIKTSALELVYIPKGDGRFVAENLTVTLTLDGKKVTWTPGTEDPANLLGTTRTLDGAHGAQTREPIEPGLISRSGWAVVDDSARPLFDSADFSFKDGAKSPWPWVQLRPAGDRQDLYFFGYGHNYKQALGDYVKVAGRIPLPPRFAFGSWWSRYWDYSDQELDDLVKGFHDNNVPLDVLVIDMGWHISKEQLEAMGEKDQSDHALGWGGYTWNPTLFPDPDAFLKKIHAEGIKTTLNLHPASGAEPWEKAYPAMARAMGIDPATRKFVPFDIADKKFATNYMNLLHHPLEQQGIDFWWLDWQQEQQTSLPGVLPTWWLNYVHFTDQQREGKRPLLFHRWGGLGNHRYQIGFSGDTHSDWESLAFQPWFTATAANVGYTYWSHDIGGHISGAISPELYTRWIQFGAFSPILRTHTTKNAASERRIWTSPEPYASVMRSTFQLREAMEPYVYTEARRTYDTGIAFLRPLYYDWPADDAAYKAKSEYLFGDQMIVAPITAPANPTSGLSTQKVWLPAGQWIEWPTGKHFSGPVEAERSFSIDQTPVYVKAGAIVPMQPPMQFTGQKPVDPLIVNVWPLEPGTSNTYSLYEDSGAAVEYQKGVFVRTPIQATQTANVLRVEVGPAIGSYPGMLTARGFELRLPADWPPASVTVNGVALKQGAGKSGWSYQGTTLTTIIPIPATSVRSKMVIQVTRQLDLMARRAQLDGFAGAMTRLRATYDALWAMHPLAAPPEELIKAMQTGDRLTYHPEAAATELAAFAAAIERAQTQVHALNNRLQSVLAQNASQSTDEAAKLNQQRSAALARAVAQTQTLTK